MALKLHKNAILTGTVESYCLVCETYFKTEEDSNKHIKKQVHIENLNSYPYLDKFKDNLIRKVKSGFYCEYCNVLLQTTAHVKGHLIDKIHYEHKGAHLLVPIEQGVFAFGNVLISDHAWHTFINNHCSICNVDIDNVNAHKADATHLLQLVQNTVDFGRNNSIYRKVTENTFQCLTCNQELPSDTFMNHFDDTEHKRIYKLCQTEKINDCNPKKKKGKAVLIAAIEKAMEQEMSNDSEQKQKEEVKNDYKITLPPEQTQTNRIMESLNRFKKNRIIVNVEKELAFCKKCESNVPFNFFVIEKHIQDHKKMTKALHETKNYGDRNKSAVVVTNVMSHKITPLEGKTLASVRVGNENMIESNNTAAPILDKPVNKNAAQLSEINNKQPVPKFKEASGESTRDIKQQFHEIETSMSFAKNHNITYNQGAAMAFCRLCKIKIPSDLPNMRLHISGKIHNLKSAKWSERWMQPIHIQPQYEFITHAALVKMKSHKDIILNFKFCLCDTSFHLLMHLNSKLWCHLCQKYVPETFKEQHVKRDDHMAEFHKLGVVTTMHREYIRSVRNQYHCGICNCMVSSWASMEKHLTTEDHVTNKNIAIYNNCVHLPKVLQLVKDNERAQKITRGEIKGDLDQYANEHRVDTSNVIELKEFITDDHLVFEECDEIATGGFNSTGHETTEAVGLQAAGNVEPKENAEYPDKSWTTVKAKERHHVPKIAVEPRRSRAVHRKLA